MLLAAAAAAAAGNSYCLSKSEQYTKMINNRRNVNECARSSGNVVYDIESRYR